MVYNHYLYITLKLILLDAYKSKLNFYVNLLNEKRMLKKKNKQNDEMP